MPTKTFTRVLTFGSYILLLFAIYGAIVVFSRRSKDTLRQETLRQDTLRQETFAQCVNRARGQPINSLKIDIRLERNKPEYEIPLSDFTNLLVMNNITKKRDFLDRLNRLTDVVDTANDRAPFKIIYEVGDEILIYRNFKHFGYHIHFAKNPERPIPIGIVTHYDVESQYKYVAPKEYVFDEEGLVRSHSS